MTIVSEGMELTVACPACGSEALYRYGKGKSGKQRFLCLMCHRQFIYGAQRVPPKVRPDCPVCGSPMHLYKRLSSGLRFRCSRYPGCRTFKRGGDTG